MIRGRANIDSNIGKFATARVWKELEKHGFKERTLEWVRNMSRSEKINLLCITDFPWLVNALTKMYFKHKDNKKFYYALREVLGSRTLSPEDIIRDFDDHFIVKTDIKHQKRSERLMVSEEKLIEGMVLCSKLHPYDSLSVGPSLIDHIDTLIELLDDVTDKKLLTFNMSCIGAVNSLEFFFSSWFNQTTLNSIGSWFAAVIERQITLGMINHLNNQDKSILANQNNPLRKQKLIRKAWNKLPDEVQEQKIASFAAGFKKALAHEKNGHVQKSLRFVEQFLCSVSKLNELQVEKSAEYAVLFKRRREPSLFIDAVMFPSFEQFESICRMHLWYLGQELLQAVGTPEQSPSPSPAPMIQEEEKKKKKPSKALKKKKKSELEKKNTGGEVTQETAACGSVKDSSSINKFEVLTSPQFGGDQYRRTDDPVPRGPRTMRVHSESDDEGSWIPVDRKLRGHLIKKKEGKNTEPKEKKTHSVRKDEKRAKSKQSILSAGVSNNNKNNLAKRVRQQMEELGSGVSKTISGGAQCHFGSSGGSRGGDAFREVRTAGRVSTAAEKNESKTVMTEDLREEQDSTTSLETESIACSLDGNNSLKPPSGRFAQNVVQPPVLRLSHIQSTERPNSKLGGGDGSSRLSYDSLNMLSPAKSFQAGPSEVGLKTDWLTAELEEILREIDFHSRAVQPLRIVAENRIKRVLAASFGSCINQLCVETYGSSATQLVIPGSDIDICIRGFGNVDRPSICSVLNTLGTNIGLFKWCTEVKMILGATVPVIKLVDYRDNPGH